MDDFERHVLSTILQNMKNLDSMDHGQLKFSCECTGHILKRLLEDPDRTAAEVAGILRARNTSKN